MMVGSFGKVRLVKKKKWFQVCLRQNNEEIVTYQITTSWSYLKRI